MSDDTGDDQSTMHVGARLRHLRTQRSLTQEQAAVAAGITRNTLAGLERNRFPNPHLSTLLALMACYDLSSLDELLGPLPAGTVYGAWESAGWPNTRRAGHGAGERI